ncbi:phosphotransferase [Caulobacter soli]|uniref:phosphotransferase n=1 Tax=Caulobacter soli TaxID=2708539 RepID=UPI0013EA7638|nr:phosphotransferase [Caulobacter soli]
MKILFVEDNEGFAGDLQPILLEIPGVEQVINVQDLEAARKALDDDLIDLIVLDLSIPSGADSDAPDPAHGQTLFYEAQKRHPGTPIFILTGSEADKFSRQLARYGNQVRLWGDKTQIETVSYFLKEEVDELVARVTAVAGCFGRMDAVAINTRMRDLGLTPVQKRMLKSYANSVDCVACDVSLLSGGLSDAKVVKATAVDGARKPQALCAGKLGSRSIVQQEKEAYEAHVRKLGVGACPALFSVVEDGVGQSAAIFYTLTDQDTLSFFERLAADVTVGKKVVTHVRTSLARWSEAATAGMALIRDVRRRLVADDVAESLYQKHDLEDLKSVEDVPIQVSQSCIHGDLHCGNVLVKSGGEAVLIDFGDAGPGYTVMDPIALELSLVFHPDAAKCGLREKLMDQLEDWLDEGKFVGTSGLGPMVGACREWAHDVAGGDLAVLAAAFSYAFRQLKYETVPTDVTIKFLRMLAERIRGATSGA